MIFVLIIQVAVVAAGVGVHLMRHRQERTGVGISEALTAWFLLSFVGLTGIWAFMGHAFMADEVADSIGFPAGNPFQFEVAASNLAFGVLGLLCLRFRGLFWWATVTGYSVFMWGAAYGHIHEMVVNDNHAAGNSGFALYADIIMPLILFALLLAHERLSSRQIVSKEIRLARAA